MNAFKTQQHRWTKGAVQTAKKILPRVWRAPLPLFIKLEATIHLTANSSYILMLLMALLMLPVLSIRANMIWQHRLLLVDLPLFSMATMAISSFYLVSQRALYPDWKKQIKYLPLLMAVGISLCVNNTRAAIEGLVGHQSDFLRTPKYGVADKRQVGRKYVGSKTILAGLEILMAAYFLNTRAAIEGLVGHQSDFLRTRNTALRTSARSGANTSAPKPSWPGWRY